MSRRAATGSQVGSAAAVETLHAAVAEVPAERPAATALLVAAVQLLRSPAGPRSGFFHELAGGGSPGRRWRLVFTAGAEEVRKARARLKKPDADEPSGVYVDQFITAVQRFDEERMENENGIFGAFGVGLGRVLTFKGPFKWPEPQKRITCGFQSATLCIGPYEFQLPGVDADIRATPMKDLPFFNFFHVDSKVAAALGRSGGMALWARTTPAFEQERMGLRA